MTWHTLAELTRDLKVDEAVVLGLVERGDLKAVRVGDEWRVSAAAFASYARRHENTSVRHRTRRTLAWSAAAGAAIAVVGLTGVALHAQSAGDGPAASLPYHGYLEQAGSPVEGKRYVTFALYNGDGTPTGWTEGQTVTVAAGHFSALLGTQSPLDALKTGVPPLSIGVTVQDVDTNGAPTGTPAPLAGRQLLASTPYARRAAPGKDFTVDGNLSAGPTTVKSLATASATINETATIASATVTGSLTAGSLAISGAFNSGAITSTGPIVGVGGRADCGIPHFDFSGCRRGYVTDAITACNYRICNDCGCDLWNPAGTQQPAAGLMLMQTPGY